MGFRSDDGEPARRAGEDHVSLHGRRRRNFGHRTDRPSCLHRRSIPECNDDACNKAKTEEQAKLPKAQIWTHLFYRHWATYKLGKRTHLFVVPARGGVARDLTPGDHDAPPFSLGGQDMYAFSPDGKEVAFTSNIDEVEASVHEQRNLHRANCRRNAEEDQHESREAIRRHSIRPMANGSRGACRSARDTRAIASGW